MTDPEAMTARRVMAAIQPPEADLGLCSSGRFLRQKRQTTAAGWIFSRQKGQTRLFMSLP